MEGNAIHLSGDPRVNRLAGRVATGLVDVVTPFVWRLHHRPVEQFVDAYRSFYGVVTSLHRTSTFVDGAKSWRKVRLLARELQLKDEVSIVHLTRDPRGFAASSRRHLGAGARDSALLWGHLHRRIESLSALASYYRLRYEDLAADPEDWIQDLLRFLGLSPEPLVQAPRSPEKHHILGSQMLRTFTGEVTLDERWRVSFTDEEQAAVLHAAGPLAETYGYVPSRSAAVARAIS